MNNSAGKIMSTTSFDEELEPITIEELADRFRSHCTTATQFLLGMIPNPGFARSISKELLERELERASNYPYEIDRRTRIDKFENNLRYEFSIDNKLRAMVQFVGDNAILSRFIPFEEVRNYKLTNAPQHQAIEENFNETVTRKSIISNTSRASY